MSRLNTFADAVAVVDESIGQEAVEFLPSLQRTDHARLDLTRQLLKRAWRDGLRCLNARQ